MIETGLVSHLLADAPLMAVIERRLYPLVLPQDAAVPAVTYQRVSTPRTLTLKGGGTTAPRFQFSAWAMTYSQAKQVGELLKAALDCYTGPMGTHKVAAFMAGYRDTYDDDTKRYGCGVDFIINYRGE
jgi:hypothetical protein